MFKLDSIPKMEVCHGMDFLSFCCQIHVLKERSVKQEGKVGIHKISVASWVDEG